MNLYAKIEALKSPNKKFCCEVNRNKKTIIITCQRKVSRTLVNNYFFQEKNKLFGEKYGFTRESKIFGLPPQKKGWSQES